MEPVQFGEDVMVVDIKTAKGSSGRSRKALSASLVVLMLAGTLPEPAFAQFDLGSFAGGMIGGMLAGRGGHGYAPRYQSRHGYAGHYSSRHAYVGRSQERRVAQTRYAPRAASHPSASPPVASAPASSGAERRNASGPGAGSLH